MIRLRHGTQNIVTRTIIITYVILAFLVTQIGPFYALNAHAQTAFNLPAVGTMLNVTGAYQPAVVAGMTVYPQSPFQFDFIIDSGDDKLTGNDFRAESAKLIKYFLAALTTPETDLWVNLSPYERDRIMADQFGQTEMGRDLLAQDYILKQLMASLMYPEDDLGAEFWKRVNSKLTAEQSFSPQDAISTFNKVWIVPKRAGVYVHDQTVFLTDSYLKVMLEDDYLSLENHTAEKKGDNSELAISKEVMRDVLIPELEREVNQGKHFAPLRQIFQSMILASWYKKNLKNSVLSQVYVDQNKVQGITNDDPKVKDKIYKQYLEAFKIGVYDFIREEYDPASQTVIPKKYFSGGVDAAMIGRIVQESQTAELFLREHRGRNLQSVRWEGNVGGSDVKASDAATLASVSHAQEEAVSFVEDNMEFFQDDRYQLEILEKEVMYLFLEMQDKSSKYKIFGSEYELSELVGNKRPISISTFIDWDAIYKISEIVKKRLSGDAPRPQLNIWQWHGEDVIVDQKMVDLNFFFLKDFVSTNNRDVGIFKFDLSTGKILNWNEDQQRKKDIDEILILVEAQTGKLKVIERTEKYFHPAIDLAIQKYNKGIEDAADAAMVADLSSYIRDLDSREWIIRRDAVELLGNSQNPDAADYLVRQASDKDVNVRHAVAKAFGNLKINIPTVASALLYLVKNDEFTNLDVSIAAVESLGSLKIIEGRSLIVDLLDKSVEENRRYAEDEEFVEAAIRTLGELGNKSDVPIFDAYLDHESPYIRQRTVESIRKLNLLNFTEILLDKIDSSLGVWDTNSHVRQEILEVLDFFRLEGEYLQRYKELIAELMDDENPYIRNVAVQKAAKYGKDSEEIKEALRSSLDDSVWQVRITVLDAIVALELNDLLSDVLDRLDKESVDEAKVRRVIIRTLGEIGKKNTIVANKLVELLDRDEGVWLEVIEVLGNLGLKRKYIVRSLIEFLRDEETQTRTREKIAIALGNIGDAEAVDALLEMLDEEDPLYDPIYHGRRAAIEALAKLKDDIQDKANLIDFMSDVMSFDPDKGVYKAAKELLESLGQKELVDEIIEDRLAVRDEIRSKIPKDRSVQFVGHEHISKVMKLDEGQDFSVIFDSTEVKRIDVLPSDAATLAGKTILLVEDDESLREVFETILTRIGKAQVILAQDGQEALDILLKRESEINAVITDLQMPRMSGDQLARVMKEKFPNIPIILQTARGAREISDAQLQYQAGENLVKVLRKPVELPNFIGAFEEIFKTNENPDDKAMLSSSEQTAVAKLLIDAVIEELGGEMYYEDVGKPYNAVALANRHGAFVWFSLNEKIYEMVKNLSEDDKTSIFGKIRIVITEEKREKSQNGGYFRAQLSLKDDQEIINDFDVQSLAQRLVEEAAGAFTDRQYALEESQSIKKEMDFFKSVVIVALQSMLFEWAPNLRAEDYQEVMSMINIEIIHSSSVEEGVGFYRPQVTFKSDAAMVSRAQAISSLQNNVPVIFEWSDLLEFQFKVKRDLDNVNYPEVVTIEVLQDGTKISKEMELFIYEDQKVIVINNFFPEFPKKDESGYEAGRGRRLLRHLLMENTDFAGYQIVADGSNSFKTSFYQIYEWNPQPVEQGQAQSYLENFSAKGLSSIQNILFLKALDDSDIIGFLPSEEEMLELQSTQRVLTDEELDVFRIDRFYEEADEDTPEQTADRLGATVEKLSEIRERISQKLEALQDAAMMSDLQITQLARRMVEEVSAEFKNIFGSVDQDKEKYKELISGLLRDKLNDIVEMEMEDVEMSDEDKQRVLSQIDIEVSDTERTEFFKVTFSHKEADAAMTSDEVGGIDLNPNNWDIEQTGTVSEWRLSPSVNIYNIQGITPIIINITPITNLPLLLGMSDDAEPEPYADFPDENEPLALLNKN